MRTTELIKAEIEALNIGLEISRGSHREQSFLGWIQKLQAELTELDQAGIDKKKIRVPTDSKIKITVSADCIIGDVAELIKNQIKDGRLELKEFSDEDFASKFTTEPTLEQRIQAQFPGKRVEMLYRRDTGELAIDHVDDNHRWFCHALAPSLKGFAGFVYEEGNGNLFDDNDPSRIFLGKGRVYTFPTAVLFEGGE